MEILLSYIGLIGVSITMIFIMASNIVHFVMWIKCFKVKECHNRQCINRVMCRKFNDILTEDEYNELSDIIKNLSDQQ